MAGIRELCARNGVPPEAIEHVFHGTTTATNAVLEHKGALTGMVTTAGFRDVLHIARHQRPQHYSIMQEVPWQDRPLVRRRHRKVVEERLVPPKGEVLVPLDEDGVRRAARELKDEGVEAIAVCFLFSYINPAHEERARAILEDHLPGVFITTSAAVSPQFRVRALYHDRHRGVHRPEGPELRAEPSRRAARRGHQGRSAHHGVQWRGRDACDGL
jgi:N-methylhydantoinase A/oxoprolinase/acetone carboxylase beta subunit